MGARALAARYSRRPLGQWERVRADSVLRVVVEHHTPGLELSQRAPTRDFGPFKLIVVADCSESLKVNEGRLHFWPGNPEAMALRRYKARIGLVWLNQGSSARATCTGKANRGRVAVKPAAYPHSPQSHHPPSQESDLYSAAESAEPKPRPAVRRYEHCCPHRLQRA